MTSIWMSSEISGGFRMMSPGGSSRVCTRRRHSLEFLVQEQSGMGTSLGGRFSSRAASFSSITWWPNFFATRQSSHEVTIFFLLLFLGDPQVIKVINPAGVWLVNFLTLFRSLYETTTWDFHLT